MDIAMRLAYRHAHRARIVALVVLGSCAAVLLAYAVLLLGGASGVPTPEVPLLGPFRWDGSVSDGIG